MHPDLEIHLLARGFVTRPQILDCGFDDRAIARMLRDGVLVRIGPGLYADGSYVRLTAAERHAVRARAVASRFVEAVAFSHQTAAVLLGLPTWGVDLDELQVTRLDTGRGRRQAGVHHHVAGLASADLVEVDDLLVTSPARTAWDLCVAESTESALVTADAVLHAGHATDDELLAQARRHAAWRGARHAKVTLSLADAGAESPGESRSRFWFRAHGLPRPETQMEIRDDHGLLVARVDFGWRLFRHLAEFDGMLKYRATHDDPEAASRAVQAEKVREDRLRAMGWGVTRIVWSDLRPGARDLMLGRLRADLGRSASLAPRRVV